MKKISENKQTIKKTVSYTGVGLHLGIASTITFKTANEDNGITFIRTDLPEKPIIPANINYVIDISRGTTIGINKEATVATIEHVLAAIRGLEIDNIIIEVNGPEVPVADGSALPFIKLLKEAEITEQNALREYFEPDEAISYIATDDNVDIVILPADELKITFMVDYKHPCLGTQYTWMPSISVFEKEFASARTFCFLHEIIMLKEKGLIKGGSLDNAIVVADPKRDLEEVKKLEKIFAIKNVKINEHGLLNGATLRYHNEFVRHKLLDLIGDMALLGLPIKGHILAARSGHKTNVELVKKLRGLYEKQLLLKKYQKKELKGIVYDINAIQKILPHRYPFLLVDKIVDFEMGKSIIGIKNVTANEPFFKGHFPGHPIMPGVLILEAMAQTGGILLLSSKKNPKDFVAYFAAMDNVKFRKPVLPGDTLKFVVKTIAMKKSLCKVHAEAFVEDAKVCEADFMATLVDK